MSFVASITSQGQLTIPREIRAALNINQAAKAVVTPTDTGFLVEPQTDFWSLAGSLKSSVKLTDQQLTAARQAFTTKWPAKLKP